MLDGPRCNILVLIEVGQAGEGCRGKVAAAGREIEQV